MQTCSWHAFNVNLVFVGEGSGCLWSVFCVLVSNIDRLLAWAWCWLSAAFAVNSTHRTVAFNASLMLRRSSRLGGRRSCRSDREEHWPFPEEKEKIFFHEWHNGGGVRASLQTTPNDNTVQSDFFSQTLFDFIRMVSHSISPNFLKRFLMSSASPEFVFWRPKTKQFCVKQV